MRKTIFILLLAGIFIPALLQGAVPAARQMPVEKHIVKNDSTGYKKRKFETDKLRSYSRNKDFIYDDALPQNEDLWGRFWKWVWGIFRRILNNKYSDSLLGYGAIAVVVAIVVYATMKMTGIDLKILTGRSRSLEVPYSQSDDNIHEINFSDEIERAVQKGNYRLAVRIFYLRTLKQLNDKGQISWQPEKTNQAYIAEIPDAEEKELFKVLTRRFEYIWYGEFHIDKDSFARIKTGFDQFNHKWG